MLLIVCCYGYLWYKLDLNVGWLTLFFLCSPYWFIWSFWLIPWGSNCDLPVHMLKYINTWNYPRYWMVHVYCSDMCKMFNYVDCIGEWALMSVSEIWSYRPICSPWPYCPLGCLSFTWRCHMMHTDKLYRAWKYSLIYIFNVEILIGWFVHIVYSVPLWGVIFLMGIVT